MKENFDDIIRRRWEERDFPVDDQHREEMAQLLDREKRRKGFPIWWFGGLGGLLLLGGMAWWMMHSSGDRVAPSIEKVSPQPPYTEEKSDQNTTSTLPSSTPPSTMTLPKNPALSSSAIEKAEQKDNITLHSKTSFTNPIAKTVSPENQNQAGTGDQNPASYYKVELDHPNEAKIASNTAAIQVYPDSVQYDPWTGEIYPTTSDGHFKFHIASLLPTSILPIPIAPMDKPGNVKAVLHHAHPIYLLAEAGIASVMASKPDYNAGFKLNAGGGLGYQLAPKMHLQWTAGYLMQDGGFHFERQSSVNQAGFALRSEFNTLVPGRLHFIYAKIGFMYRLHRHAFNAHTGINYLYGAQGSITVQTHDQLQAGDHTQSSYGWLKTDGLKKWQWFADASYGYLLFPKLYLQSGISLSPRALNEKDPELLQQGYYWEGITERIQPFITINYLLYGKL